MSLFVHAASSLSVGGLLVMVNQTEEERDAQRAILDTIEGLEIVASEAAATRFVDYYEHTSDRAITVARKC